MRLKVNAIIERDRNGNFGVLLEDPHFLFAPTGYGITPQDAIADFFRCYKDMQEELGTREIPEIDVTFSYDLPSFLAEYRDRLSLKGLQVITGINACQLNHYISGFRKPSTKTVKKIEDAIHAFAKELAEVNLSFFEG